MMIKQSCIENVIERSDIVDVIRRKVDLKKSGANYTGCCPFHDEKTASFVVSPVKQIYKCFGCGVSGKALKFVMEVEKKSYPEAIILLAGWAKVDVEYDEGFDKEKHKEQLEEKVGVYKVNEYALNAYRKNVELADGEVKKYLFSRFTKEDIITFQIGVAGDNSKFLSSVFSETGMVHFADKAGLINQWGDHYLDFLRNRIVFPIQDINGRCVGFGGRVLPGETKYAKYMNVKDGPVYNKSNILYGLHLALPGISREGFAYVTEGYTDVIAMHRNGMDNTVASCGTAFTEAHAKLLKRFTDTIVISTDGDTAGIKSRNTMLPLLLQYQFKIYIIDFADGLDPDSFFEWHCNLGFSAKINYGFSAIDFFESIKIDALVWKFKMLFNGVGSDINLHGKASDEALGLVTLIKNEAIRSGYIDLLKKEYGVKPTVVTAAVKKSIQKDTNELLSEDDEALKKLKPDQRDEYLKFGFFVRKDGAKTGYYFRSASGSNFQSKTNFVVDPLYHVYGNDNRRMIKVSNGITEDVVIEMPSKNMLSLDAFCASLYNEGYYLPKDGFTKDHLLRIHNRIGNNYPRVYEITTLGWQPEGFFAFQNKVYKPALKDEVGELCDYNEYGIVEVGERKFLSPSLSKSNEGLREGENVYENDLYLQHKPSGINFEKWTDLMAQVYGKNAWAGIAWVIATIHKDLIEKTTRVPLLNPYGQKGSGKSEFGNSIQYLFFSGKDSFGELYKPMNLNQGTDFAFFNRYERFSNCPNVLNEFDENAIKDEWFRAIKSAYDSEGREKGKGVKNQTGSQKIRSTTVIIGQYLGTKDDNSVLSRSIPLSFELIDSRPEDMVMFFRQLKKHEEDGLSGIICELLDMRSLFARKFPERFYEIVNEMQQLLIADGIQTIDRILKNICLLLTCIDLTKDRFDYPFKIADYKIYCKDFIKRLTNLIAKTSKLAEFWKVMEYLIDTGVLEEGFDYELKEGVASVKLLDGSTETKDHSFNTPVDLIFMRLNAVHSHYEKEFRSRTGQKATNEETVGQYIREQKYYLGTKKSHKFTSNTSGKNINTSCIVLDLEKLGVNLVRSNQSNQDMEEVVGMVGVVTKGPKATSDENVFGFTVKRTKAVQGANGMPMYEDEWVKCFTTIATVASMLEENMDVKLDGVMTPEERFGKKMRSMTVRKIEVNGMVLSLEGVKENSNIGDDLPF